MVRALCVGAGEEQIPSIIEAKKLQLQVVAVDANPSAVGLSLADHGLVIDIADEPAVIEVAKQYHVSFVLPAPVGRYLTTVGAVNDALGLRGITRRAAANCTDKRFFNNILQAAELDHPRQVVTRGRDCLLNEVQRFGTPCVLKPRFGSGSRGVFVIQSAEEIEEGVDAHLRAWVDASDSLVEELVEGQMASIDGAIIDGHFTLTLMREKILTSMPYRVEVGFMAPARFNSEVYERVKDVIANCAKAAGLNHCLIHADIVVKEKGSPVVIEMAGRPSGLSISSKMVPVATGINFLGEGTKMLLGEQASFEPKRPCPVVLHFLSLPSGRLTWIPDLEAIKKRKGVLDFLCRITPGEFLPEITSARNTLARGFVLVTASTLEEALDEALRIVGLFKVSSEGVRHE